MFIHHAFPTTSYLVQGSTVVNINQNPVSATACLGRIALAIIVASIRQWITRQRQRSGRLSSTSIALRVVFRTAVRQPTLRTPVKTVGNSHVVPTTGDRNTFAQCPGAAIGVASHQVPRSIALASKESLHPIVVDCDGETVPSATCLGFVAGAGHAAVAAGCSGCGESIAAPAFGRVFCASVFEALSATI